MLATNPSDVPDEGVMRGANLNPPPPSRSCRCSTAGFSQALICQGFSFHPPPSPRLLDLYVHFSTDLKYSLSYRVNSTTERQRTKLSSRSHRHRVLGFLLVAQTDRIPLRLSAKPTECLSYSYQFQICILLYHHELKRLLIQDFQKNDKNTD